MHQSVLLKEAINGLDIKSGDIFVDATCGLGGHSEYVCQIFKDKVKIIAIDEDDDAVNMTWGRLKLNHCSNFICLQGNFRNLREILNQLEIEKVNKILLDLGMSSYQIEKSGRGFSFLRNEPLLMNFNKKTLVTAQDIVNNWKEENLVFIFKEYGEEKFANRIAKKIVEERKKKKIETTFDLIDVIRKAIPRKAITSQRKHFATKVFQALRIAVNQELDALQDFLNQSFDCLEINGRIAIISFHSLEDRIVKNFFKEKVKNKEGELITKKPIIPSKEEIVKNIRSRSAKLRIIKKIKN